MNMRRLKYWVNNAKQEIISLYYSHIETYLANNQGLIKPYWTVEHINLKKLSIRLYYFLNDSKALKFIKQLTRKTLRSQIKKQIDKMGNFWTFTGTIVSIIAIILAKYWT